MSLKTCLEVLVAGNLKVGKGNFNDLIVSINRELPLVVLTWQVVLDTRLNSWIEICSCLKAFLAVFFAHAIAQVFRSLKTQGLRVQIPQLSIEQFFSSKFDQYFWLEITNTWTTKQSIIFSSPRFAHFV